MRDWLVRTGGAFPVVLAVLLGAPAPALADGCTESCNDSLLNCTTACQTQKCFTKCQERFTSCNAACPKGKTPTSDQIDCFDAKGKKKRCAPPSAPPSGQHRPRVN